MLFQIERPSMRKVLAVDFSTLTSHSTDTWPHRSHHHSTAAHLQLHTLLTVTNHHPHLQTLLHVVTVTNTSLVLAVVDTSCS